MHQGMPPSPQGKVTRVIAYVCMAPTDCLTAEDRAVRADAWAKRQGTTHSPRQCLATRPHAVLARQR